MSDPGAPRPQRLSPVPMIGALTRVERLGSTLVAITPTGVGTVDLAAMDDSFFFATLEGTQCSVVATGPDDGLVAVTRSPEVLELHVLSTGRALYPLPPLCVDTVSALPVAGAVSCAVVATVTPGRELRLRSAVNSGTGSVTALPADVPGPVGAVGLLSGAVAVAVGSSVLLYRVSASLRVQSRLVVRDPFGRDQPVCAVTPLDRSGTLLAACGNRLCCRSGSTLVRTRAPAKIGQPIVDLLMLSTGVVVVGPTGVWGLSGAPEARPTGRAFVHACSGAYGAVPLASGDGVCVWTATYERLELRLTPAGFVKQ